MRISKNRIFKSKIWLAGFSGATLISLLFYTFELGVSMPQKYTPLIDATMEIKLELTMAHLWFEEFINGDQYEDIQVVWEHLDMADWYAGVMLEGGQNSEGTFLPVSDDEMRLSIVAIRERISKFRQMTQLRLDERISSLSGTLMDQRYDLVFKDLITRTDAIETDLNTLIVNKLSRFKVIQVALLTTVILLSILTGLVFYSDRRKLNVSLESLASEISERKQIEKNLNKLSAAVEQSPTSIIITDTSGSIEYVNPKFMEVTGYSRDEVIGQNPKVLKSGKQPKSYYKDLWSTITSGNIWTGEFYNKKKNGKLYWESASISPIHDESGKIIQYVAIKEDITERKQAEEALKASEERFRQMFSNHDAVMLLIEPESGQIIDANRAAIKFYGYEKTQLCGMNIENINMLSSSQIAAERRRALKEEQSYFVFPHRLADGEKRIVEVHSSPVSHNKNLALFSIIHDITKRKEAEDNFSKLFNLSRDGYVISKGNGEILNPNPAFTKMLGYTDEEIMKISWRKLTPTRWLDWELKHHGTQLMERGYTDLYEKEYIRKDGTRFPVEIQAFRLDDSDNLDDLEIAAFVRDISNRKNAEIKRQELEDQLRQSQKLEAIGTMAGGIAHDFNNILQTQLLHAEIVQRQLPDDSKLNNNIRHILNAGNHARELVKSILTFSRENEVKSIPFKIQDVLSETIQMLRSIFPATIQIDANIDMSVANITGDPVQIQQIVLNLCNNASQAIGNASGIVKISLQSVRLSKRPERFGAYPGRSSLIELIVSDNGMGMSEEVASRVFDPFFTTKQVGEGTGLGLSVIHGIIKEMNGEIHVSSQAGVGTTFTLLFPTSTDGEEIDIATKTTQDQKHRWSKSVLLVEDDPDILEITRVILKDHGFVVITGRSGAEAITLLHDNFEKIDLIITDLAMPKISGLKFSREALEMLPHIPIILMSGNLDEAIEAECKELGIRTLMKPWFEIDLINEIVALSLEQSE